MNGAMRCCFKPCSRSILSKLKPNIELEFANQCPYSTLWNTTSVKSTVGGNINNTNDNYFSSNQFSTKSENELVKNLEEKINEERKKLEPVPSKVDDFQVQSNGSNVVLVKSLPDEKITVSFDVSNTVLREGYDPFVDSDDEFNNNRKDNLPQLKPDIEVNITSGDTTLKFVCIFFKENPDDYTEQAKKDLDEISEGYSIVGRERVYLIREFAVYKGKVNKSVYRYRVTPKDFLFYLSLMDFLHERGVNNGFFNRLALFSTAYEQRCCVDALKELKKFALHRKVPLTS